jgi:hypothetical protein
MGKNMNKKTLNSAFTALIKKLEQTEKFVLDQAPEICKQMIRETMIANIMGIVGCTIAAIILSIAAYKLGFHIWGTESLSTNDNMGSGLLFFLALVVNGLSLAGIYDGVYGLIFIKNCPKLYLLRSFRKLIK